VREWLEHHVLLGAGHIYVWDHSSTPPMQDVMQDYIDAGIVNYTYVEVDERFTEPDYVQTDSWKVGRTRAWMDERSDRQTDSWKQVG
jgi:Glycosyltransferase family 92